MQVVSDCAERICTFDSYLWQFVNGRQLKRKRNAPLPATTEISMRSAKTFCGEGSNCRFNNLLRVHAGHWNGE